MGNKRIKEQAVWCFYSDGSADPRMTVIGAGVVIKSPRGQITKHYDFKEGSELSSLEAELMAFRLAVELASGISESVVFYMDNKVVYDLFVDSKMKTPKRIKHSEDVCVTWGELSLLNQYEIVLTNDNNDPFMRLAHEQANIGRIEMTQSCATSNSRRRNRLKRNYKYVLYDDLLKAACRDISDEMIGSMMNRLAKWIDKRATAAVMNNCAMGYTVMGEEDLEDRILYQNNFRLIGMYQVVHQLLNGRHEFSDDLREASKLMAEDYITHPLLWMESPEIEVLPEGEGKQFCEMVIGREILAQVNPEAKVNGR